MTNLTVIARSTVNARRAHSCETCGRPIVAGTRYARAAVLLIDGSERSVVRVGRHLLCPPTF